MLETTGQGIWVEARKKSDFKMFYPSLEKMIDLKAICRGRRL